MKYRNLYFCMILFTILVEKSFSCPLECNKEGSEVICSNANYKYLLESLSCSNAHSLKIIETNISSPVEDIFYKFGIEGIHFVFLNNDNITYVDFKEFCKLKRMEFLSLAHNQIIELQSGKTSCNKTALQRLNLDYNDLREISFSLFESQTSMYELNVTFNPISEVAECLLDTNLDSLELINLSNNIINKINYNAFRCVKNLFKLNLERNNLTDIDSRVFYNLMQLKDLNLSYNKLTSIHQELFHSLFKLVNLDLSNNKLKSLEKYTFFMLPQLEVLDISNNQIEKFYADDLEFTDLRTISLDNNQWDCKDLVSIYKTLRQAKVSVIPGQTYNHNHVLGIACEKIQKID